MTKTALTQMIESFEVMQKECKTVREILFFDGVIAMAISLLPVEREQITDAFDHGLDNKWNNTEHIQIYEMEELHNNEQSAPSEYFNRNFTQYTPQP